MQPNKLASSDRTPLDESLNVSLPATTELNGARAALAWYVVRRLLPLFPFMIRNHHFREWFYEPMNYWRQIELPLALVALGHRGARRRILDIGSPKLLSLYMADVYGLEVHASDISNYFVRDFLQFRRLLKTRYLVVRAIDGRSTDYDAGFFDAVFSISVIEHMPEGGDRACIQEAMRLLKPGGLFVFTVPIIAGDRQGVIDEQMPDGRFHQRRYSLHALQDRVALADHGKITRTYLVAERPLGLLGGVTRTGGLWPENCNVLAANPLYRLFRKFTKYALVPLSHYAMSSVLRSRSLYFARTTSDARILDAVVIMERR